MKIIADSVPEYPDFKDLISEEDWTKFFEGKSFMYNDPLMFALVRATEKLKETR